MSQTTSIAVGSEGPIAYASSLPPLEPGDHLDQETFHARYEAMPNVKAELIEGTVYMPSPAKTPHGQANGDMITWMGTYRSLTPGVHSYPDATVILGPSSEVQPDGWLMIPPELGGRMRWSQRTPGYLEGGPELVGEIGSSTESYDLHGKRRDYERAGVQEYLVVALRQQRVFWFVLREGAFVDLPPSGDGIFRSQVFPGLWLDGAALLRGDLRRVLDVLQLGVATPEHAAFVSELQRRVKPSDEKQPSTGQADG